MNGTAPYEIDREQFNLYDQDIVLYSQQILSFLYILKNNRFFHYTNFMAKHHPFCLKLFCKSQNAVLVCIYIHLLL